MTLDDLVARSERIHQSGGRIEGGSPLAGHLSIASLLVRESIQNSWDARDDDRDGPVRFEIDGWDLDADRLDALRSLLPVGDLRGFRPTGDEATTGVLHPARVLERPAIRTLVISDRNTVGLCGPSESGRKWDGIRHGRPLPRPQQRFANFVRNQGRASKNIGEGDGGSYGIGKSSLWLASECGTILVHTRTTDDAGDPVERFIGLAYGEYFDMDGHEYTGRHFIGRDTGHGYVDPLTGSAASEAARRLQLPSYAIDGKPVDGTSIVIVAPRLSFDWRFEMDRLRDAVRWHAWPKLVPGVRAPAVAADLDVRLRWNNNDVEVPDPLDDHEIRPYAMALLDCARGRNQRDEGHDHEIRCGRPKKHLGDLKFREAGVPDDNVFHTTLTREELEREAESLPESDAAFDLEPTVDFPSPWGQIALIRREPLLLVGYQPIGGPDLTGNSIGVFLSADDEEVEEALTKAEPPAHDEWLYRIVPKDHPRDHRRTFAKRTVLEINAARRAFIAGFRGLETGQQGGGEQQVSRQLSEGLFGGLGGRRRPKKPSNRNTSVSRIERVVLSLVDSRQESDHVVHELDVRLVGVSDGPARRVTLTAGGAGRDNAGTMEVGHHVRFAWTDSEGTITSGPDLELDATDSTRLSLLVMVSSNLRFRPKVTMEVADVT